MNYKQIEKEFEKWNLYDWNGDIGGYTSCEEEIKAFLKAKLTEVIDEMIMKNEIAMFKGANKWAEMMVKQRELKIGDDKVVDGQTIYGWTGEDEIASSIVGYIREVSELKEYKKKFFK